MSKRNVKMWFEPEADFLEVVFDQKPGYFRPTENDQVMERVDEDGNMIGFSVLRVSTLKKAPLEVALRKFWVHAWACLLNLEVKEKFTV